MDLVKKLQSKGFELKVDGNRLFVAPKDKLTPELTKLIEQNVKAIIKAMQEQPQQQEPTQRTNTPAGPEQPQQSKQKPFKNLSLTQLTALISKGIPEGNFIIVDFEGVRAAVCRKENERELQERGLTTLTPKELAMLYLADTDKETLQNLLRIKKEFAGHIVKCQAYNT